MPLGKDVGANRSELRKANPDWSEERVLAASLEAARNAGNVKVKAPSTVKRKKRKH